jgi:DNA uptake protein ComE-like DNA-binding protein
MSFKQLIRDYFTFSRGERRGVIILIILIFLFAVVNKFIFYFEKPGKIDVVLLDSTRQKLGAFNDSVNQAFQKSESDVGLSGDNRTLLSEAELFPFDPNTATDADFRRLGLSEKLVGTIRNYQAKGGSFRNQADFFKIYGLSENQKQQLSGFIVIEEKAAAKGAEITTKLEETVKPYEMLTELNAADSVQLKLLPGIGDKLSKRIVKYRDLLGGFYSVDQLKEVYGLTDETMKLISGKVTADVRKIRKLDLNFADLNELSRHPYLKRELAVKIIGFRSKYGSIRDFTVLRDSMILNMNEYTRLKPYF